MLCMGGGEGEGGVVGVWGVKRERERWERDAGEWFIFTVEVRLLGPAR